MVMDEAYSTTEYYCYSGNMRLLGLVSLLFASEG